MKIDRLETHVYRVPTDLPEADGTIAWDATTMVLVEAMADSGQCGLGFSYASASAAPLVHEVLTPVVVGCPVDDVRHTSGAMIAAVRNVGRPGVAATAISAVDVALWDLKARVADQPLFRLLGPHREAVPVYGSGGFTTYTDDQLARQLAGWVDQGIPRVKMKIGTDWGRRPELDLHRVQVARQAIVPSASGRSVGTR